MRSTARKESRSDDTLADLRKIAAETGLRLLLPS